MSVEAAGFSSYDLISGDTGGTCCPPVVDPYSWVALLGGITLTTYFLRVAIIKSYFPLKKFLDLVSILNTYIINITEDDYLI